MELLAAMMAIVIMVYGLFLMIGGPTLANRVMKGIFRGVRRPLERALRQGLRLAWRGAWALMLLTLRATWWLVRAIGRVIGNTWRRYPRASGLFWGALAGASALALILWIRA